MIKGIDKSEILQNIYMRYEFRFEFGFECV